MPATLRRKNRQELTLRKSFVEAMKMKLSSTFFRRPSDKVSPRPPEIRREYEPSYDPYLQRTAVPGPPAAFYLPQHIIRNLPPEILASIFALGSEDDPLLPLCVSHVCRFWREVACNTPILWRRIILGSHYKMWRETMYRARACPLDIEFKSRNRLNGPLTFYEVQRYMHLVLPHIRRWRSLSIVFTEYQPYLWNAALSECCTRSGQTQVPELVELCLAYRHNDDTKEFCLFSGKAPRLRRLIIDGIRLTWLPSLFRNLTHLDYTHHGLTNRDHAIQEVFNLLCVSSRLVELLILFPNKGKDAPRTSLSGIIHLPCLEILSLKVESSAIPEELMIIASMFNTPRLSELHLVDVEGQRSSFPNISNFWKIYAIPRSVQTLYLQYRWYTKEAVVLWTHTGNLEWLVVRRGHAKNDQWFRLGHYSKASATSRGRIYHVNM